MANWLDDLILSEELEKLRKQQAYEVSAPSWMSEDISIPQSPVTQPETEQPNLTRNAFVPQDWYTPVGVTDEVQEKAIPSYTYLQPSATKTVAPAVAKKEEDKPAVPFWQRALQVFGTPFDWVDENIIKPGLAVGATETGLLKDVKRLPGEDYFEWKKRSWESWKAPGIDIDVPWGDGDIRVDLKGVLEFAPWFLIPGAGQVGTTTRAARGVAGILGKMGTVGKIAGTAVELSPWGLAEKGLSAAAKTALKGVSRISGKVGEKAFGAIPEKKVSPAVEEFTKFFKEKVLPRYEKFQPTKKGTYARGEAITRDIDRRILSGELKTPEEIIKATGELSGIGTKIEFAVPTWERAEIQKHTMELVKDIVRASERGYVNLDTRGAFLNLLIHGEIPQPHHLREFARVFGKDFAQTVSKLKGVKRSNFENVLDFLNIPRAVLASGDISAVARQGLILGLAHPTKVPRSFGMMVKSLFSEKMALQTDDAMRADPLFNEFVQVAKGYIAPIEKGAALSKAEESFASSIAENIPFVRRSERAFITYLNELRFASYKSVRNAIVATGGGDKELEMIGKFINLASGRGELPKSLDKFAPALNTLLFSPRLQASTLELPFQIGKMLMSKNPYMRKEAAKALVTFAGGGTALLLLLKNSGVGKVEFDPRSGDFGKIQIGDTRLDIWRGYAQYARFAAQLLTGQKKSAYGNMSKKDRYDTAFRFLQSKSSPAFGLMVDLLKGENYMGDPMFEGTTGTLKAARERMMPLALQDIIDAMEQNGINGLWTAAPATLGIGVLTYIDEYTKTQNKIAKEAGFESWDEIDPKTQREIWNRSPELQAARIQLDRRVMDTAWGEWRSAGVAIEDNFKNDVELATEQFRQTGDGYTYREKVRDAFTARRGAYDAREKDARFEEITDRFKTEDPAQAIITLGREQLAIKVYNDALYSDDMYDEFGDYRWDVAEERKKQLKMQLGNEMYNYVEEYQNLKYEDFPEEYKELAKAKIILKPYWQVRDNLEKMFGKMYVESSHGQRMITKLRQQMRMSDPVLDKYYKMFYTQT